VLVVSGAVRVLIVGDLVRVRRRLPITPAPRDGACEGTVTEQEQEAA
jgi:hypothetical protein